MQGIFDRVAGHLLEQKRKSRGLLPNNRGVSCLYRGPDGLKCAAGVLIPDELYSTSLEGTSFLSLPVDVKRSAGGIDQESVGLIKRLQSVHDTCEPIDWRMTLEGVARSFNLSAAALEESS